MLGFVYRSLTTSVDEVQSIDRTYVLTEGRLLLLGEGRNVTVSVFVLPVSRDHFLFNSHPDDGEYLYQLHRFTGS